MIDRNKVMQALKCCSDLSGKSCAKCTYVTDDFCLGNGSPIGQLAHDALELLKEQEPVMWSYDGYNCFVCSNCGLCINDEVHYMMDKPISFCPVCGRKVKWE